MKRHPSIALLILLVSTCGCGEVRESYGELREVYRKFRESWEACAEAARDVHRGDAQALCGRFSEQMLSALPCDAVGRVLRHAVDAVGEPVGECRWAYTYRIQSVDPLRATAIYKCPFAREAVSVTVSVEVTDSSTRISGLWTDASRIRSSGLLLRFELCREIDERRNACIERTSQAKWRESRISVWNQWQNLKGGDEVVWEWHAPDGEKAAEFRYEVEESPPFDYRTWSYIEPEQLEVESPYGTWTAKIGLNGKELEGLHFEVVP